MHRETQRKDLLSGKSEASQWNSVSSLWNSVSHLLSKALFGCASRIRHRVDHEEETSWSFHIDKDLISTFLELNF